MSFEGAAARWGLAALLSALLWVAVAAERGDELSLAVPVVLEHLPQGLAVQSAPSSVQVTLSGPRIVLVRARFGGSPLCRLDLAGAGEGALSFPSLEHSLSLDRELRIARVQPGPVTVVLARERRR